MLSLSITRTLSLTHTNIVRDMGWDNGMRLPRLQITTHTLKFYYTHTNTQIVSDIRAGQWNRTPAGSILLHGVTRIQFYHAYTHAHTPHSQRQLSGIMERDSCRLIKIYYTYTHTFTHIQRHGRKTIERDSCGLNITTNTLEFQYTHTQTHTQSEISEMNNGMGLLDLRTTYHYVRNTQILLHINTHIHSHTYTHSQRHRSGTMKWGSSGLHITTRAKKQCL